MHSNRPAASQNLNVPAQEQLVETEFSGKESHRTASHSDIWCQEGRFSRDCAKAGAALTLLQASVKCHHFHKACVFPSPLPPPAPRASCSHRALTPGGLCLSPHSETEACEGRSIPGTETPHEVPGDQRQQSDPVLLVPWML